MFSAHPLRVPLLTWLRSNYRTGYYYSVLPTTWTTHTHPRSYSSAAEFQARNNTCRSPAGRSLDRWTWRSWYHCPWGNLGCWYKPGALQPKQKGGNSMNVWHVSNFCRCWIETAGIKWITFKKLYSWLKMVRCLYNIMYSRYWFSSCMKRNYY